jgi:hypothetical protein
MNLHLDTPKVYGGAVEFIDEPRHRGRRRGKASARKTTTSRQPISQQILGEWKYVAVHDPVASTALQIAVKFASSCAQTPIIRQVPLGYVPQWLPAMPFETWSSAILNDILFLFSNTLPLVFYSFLSLSPVLWPGPLTGLEFTILPSRADSYPSNLFIIVYSGKKYSRLLCLSYTKAS